MGRDGLTLGLDEGLWLGDQLGLDEGLKLGDPVGLVEGREVGHASKLQPGVSVCHPPAELVEWHGLCRLRCLSPPPQSAVHSVQLVHAVQQLSSHREHGSELPPEHGLPWPSGGGFVHVLYQVPPPQAFGHGPPGTPQPLQPPFTGR